MTGEVLAALRNLLVVSTDDALHTAFRSSLARKMNVVEAKSMAAARTAWQAHGDLAGIVLDGAFCARDALLRMPLSPVPGSGNGAPAVFMVPPFAVDEALAQAIQALQPAMLLPDRICSPASTILLHTAIARNGEMKRERALREHILGGALKMLIDTLRLLDRESARRTNILHAQCVKVCRELKISRASDVEVAVMLLPLGDALLPAEFRGASGVDFSPGAAQRKLIAEAPIRLRALLGNLPHLERICDILCFARKGFDGSGDPVDGPRGSDLPFGARLLRILVDLWHVSPPGGPDGAAFSALAGRKGQYDTGLLTRVQNCLLAHDASPNVNGEMEIHAVSALRPGDRLLDDVLMTQTNELVLARGHELSEKTVNRLAHYDALNGLRRPFRVARAHASLA